MTWLLDTNIISETSKPEPDANCVAWLKARRGQCQLSSVTVSELRYGIERMPEGKRKADDFIADVERQFDWYLTKAGWEVADRYLDAVERDLPRRLLELPGAQ